MPLLIRHMLRPERKSSGCSRSWIRCMASQNASLIYGSLGMVVLCHAAVAHVHNVLKRICVSRS